MAYLWGCRTGWIRQINSLSITGGKYCQEKGHVSNEAAMQKAVKEYEEFRVRQDQEYISEFDLKMAQYLKGENE